MKYRYVILELILALLLFLGGTYFIRDLVESAIPAPWWLQAIVFVIIFAIPRFYQDFIILVHLDGQTEEDRLFAEYKKKEIT